MKKVFLVIFLIAIFLLIKENKHAFSQTLIVLDEFDYGSLIVINNNQPRDFIVRPNGNTSFNNNHFTSLTPPIRARIQVRDAPANTAFSVTVAATPITAAGPSGKSFTIADIQVRPNNLITNNSGQRNIRIGSTLRTDGDGLPYVNDNYTGSVLITVFF